MVFKSVTTIATRQDVDRTALNAAVQIARREGGHLEVLCLGIDRTQPGYYYAGADSITLQFNSAEAETDAKVLDTEISKHLATSDISWSTRALSAQLPGLAQFLAHRMRYSEIAVFAQPYGEGRDHVNGAIVEAALFGAEIPVLVMPDGTEMPDPIDRIVVAWNESPEALAAVRCALPLLISAEIVNIAIVDPPSHALDRSDPGGALANMLSRHGIMAEVSILAKTLPRVSDVIARHIVDQEADLLVMGAYGHSRIRESILGGATRHALEMAKLPVFMVH